MAFLRNGLFQIACWTTSVFFIARARLVDREMEKARNDNRRILIYPEGHLSPVGQQRRYRKGVYHMYRSYQCAAAPVATNLGLRQPQRSWRLTPGDAVIEFLDPIPPGLEKEPFMKRLESAIEARSLELLGQERPDGVDIGAVLADPQG